MYPEGSNVETLSGSMITKMTDVNMFQHDLQHSIEVANQKMQQLNTTLAQLKKDRAAAARPQAHRQAHLMLGMAKQSSVGNKLKTSNTLLNIRKSSTTELSKDNTFLTGVSVAGTPRKGSLQTPSIAVQNVERTVSMGTSDYASEQSTGRTSPIASAEEEDEMVLNVNRTIKQHTSMKALRKQALIQISQNNPQVVLKKVKQINRDKRIGLAKVHIKDSEASFAANSDSKYSSRVSTPEGHQKNANRKLRLIRIKKSLVNELSN